MKKNIIYLTGFMGAGKSASAKRLSQNMKLPWYDTDKMVEDAAGKAVKEIFDTQGEARFREMEREALLKVTHLAPCIVSVGGGTPAYSDNMRIMKSTGTVVALTASPDEIFKRLKESSTPRPLLQCDDPYSKIIALMQKRAYYYIMSDIIIDTDDKTIAEVVANIEGELA